jgi:5-methylcytosine-specific restriction endonuclease McrA
MIQIAISSKSIENFKKQVLSNFFDKGKEKKFGKKEDKKIIWEITLDELDRLIKTKLKDYPSEITLEKLIVLNYNELCHLKDFISKNKYKTDLNNQEKDYFYTLYSRLKKVEYIKDLEITVCPYCNRNYIFNFQKKDSLEATAQLDHFFDKSKYPYFAVSIYNLVPSCSTCNQRKSNKPNAIYHPYVESFNKDMKFKLYIDNGAFYYDQNAIKIDIKVLNNHDKVKSHIETFNIENLYNEHKDTVIELIQKAEIYNDSYIDELFNRYEGTLFKNREDLLRLITCGYITEEEINNRPLSKLIKDISEELGLV